ncbi:efflux RND transporter periplasmic adaptor subunit [Pseudomonas sp. R3.Fl]|jgi:multidrug efflux system membrane fusion protein|uniref:efflux RND transporter periplasmic adaptor subunit n=1 Tax=Pseudomonas TaxID=286 RepID=UPI0002A37FB5|nr:MULTISPECIES: efflux RND transporter periplasmic adaptor subunit [Pseudomonas]KWR80997.1 efflux transporter periplasmic adaptor subunit [Pseudomonas sp. PI1]MBB1606413.1 efflux transporter periplasmic adaptor subunit [Pseudomonas sp. UMC76]MBB1640813.1 efflux transporter periplasmic adaptor subunit [Pseudomonas sp. UME83]MCL6688699.1 efflux RND transporter periplasmic adaptor subunit [Pseudomonas sp. R3.Fl]NTX91098.1 efflux RND transporter periplasmic adaptor subunit [Pseudomonas sp. UMA643
MFRHALSVAVPLAFSLTLAACGNGEPAKPALRPAMVVQPQLARSVTEAYPGEVRARHEPELAFRIGGKVAKRLVETGERVRRDQPLAELDPEDVRLQLEANRAQVAAAEANLQTVRSEYQRYKVLLERKLVSQSQFDNIENTYRAGEARMKQVRAEYDVARNQADYAVLRAPQDGVISARRVEVGQVVAAGQTVFTLAADGDREVLISFPEHAIERFRIGEGVSVELWSQPDKRFSGHIRELSPAADPQSRTFAARVAFDDAKVPAELGQSARVYIHSEGAVPLAVPLAAVSAEGGQPFVWVVDPKDASLHRRPVRIGPYTEDRVPVLEGLQPDDWVVAAGVQVLREGQQVRPVDRENRSVKLLAKE